MYGESKSSFCFTGEDISRGFFEKKKNEIYTIQFLIKKIRIDIFLGIFFFLMKLQEIYFEY